MYRQHAQKIKTDDFKSLYQANTSNVDLDFANKFETLLNTSGGTYSIY